MQTEQTQTARVVPPIPGGGSWTFNEEQWAWISNDPAPAEVPVAVRPDDAGSEQAALATDQE
jgi:hypothetical protein